MRGRILTVAMGLIAMVVAAGCAGGGTGDACDRVECSGHGVCALEQGQPRCYCEVDYTPDGLECVPYEDPCTGVTCSDHGQCAVSQGEPRCFCEAGFTAQGLECLPEGAPCDGVACSGHGSCQVDAEAPVCVCDIGYHAEELECVPNDPDEPCMGVTCSGHGSCVSEQGQAHCQCDAGYHAEGLACVADEVDPLCADVDCSGHGRCEVEDQAAACDCDPGFAADGLACVEIDPCLDVTCSDHGECQAVDGLAVCHCDPGYIPSGAECLAEPDDGADPVWFVHVSDMHFGESDTIAADTQLLVDEVIPTIAPVATVNSGDVTDGGAAAQWSDYRAVVDSAVPAYPAYLEIVGNHDVKEDHLPNFLSQSVIGRAGEDITGQTFIETDSGRIRLLRTNTADSDTNALNVAGIFGQAQFDALNALDDLDPPSRFVIASGHHPLTGLERLYLGYTRMQALLTSAGARIYFCGHVHWQAFSWLGETLVSQTNSFGKSNPPVLALVALDQTGPAARFVTLNPSVSWPVVLITTPADPALGGQNPYATQQPGGGQLTARAIAFSPEGVDGVVFQLGDVEQEGAQVALHVYEATFSLPAGPAELDLSATATSAVGSGDDSLTLTVR